MIDWLMDLVFMLHWPVQLEIPMVSIALGLITGLSYGLLAVGIILVYRSSRVLNLAHGEIGALAAAVVAVLVNDNGWSYWTAALAALVVAGILGGLVELVVIRRLAAAPRLIVLVATMGVAQLFLFTTYALNSSLDNKSRLEGFPVPFAARIDLGALRLLSGEIMLLVAVPLITLGLALFFRRSSFGVAIRAASENADSARLVGIPTRRISLFVWVVAAMLAAATALMLAPGRGLTVTESLGPDLLMRALAAAVLARMTSLPRAVLAGIGIGIVEKVVAWNYAVGEVELVLFVIVLGGLLLQHRAGTRDEESSSWSLGQVIRPLPRALQALRIVRVMNWGALAAFVVVAAVVPHLLSNSQTFAATSVLAFAIVGLSVTILTGYAGQISLGQIGFFGIGAATSYQLTVELYVPFWLALLLAGVAGAFAAVLIGLPALRMKGLYLAVTTLAFALVTQKWLISQDWMAGSGVTSPRPYWGPFDFVSQRSYYYVALAGLLFAMLLCRNVLRSGTGRLLLAVRDNENQSAAFTVSTVRTKLTAFALSGFLAAFAGAIYGHGIQNFQVSNFPVSDSLRVVSMTIIGGLGSIPGTILGSFLVIGIDRLVDVAYVRLLTTSIGLLLLLLYLPGGLGQLIYAARDRLFMQIARRRGIDLSEGEQRVDVEPGEVEPSEVVRALTDAELVVAK